MADPIEQEKPFADEVDTLLSRAHTEGNNYTSEKIAEIVLRQNPIKVFKGGKPDPDSVNEFFALLLEYDDIDPFKAVKKLYFGRHPIFDGATEEGLREFIDLSAESSVIKNERMLGELRRASKGKDNSKWYSVRTGEVKADLQAARTIQEGLWARANPTPARRRR